MSISSSDVVLLGAVARHAAAHEKAEVAAMEAASPPHPQAEELLAAVKNDEVDTVTRLLDAGVPAMVCHSC